MIEKGISRLGRPINDVQVAIENVGNIEVAKLEKGLTVMATISGGAPMLGFLGTVTGMVRAFYEMANAGSGNIDITLLSGKGSQSLLRFFPWEIRVAVSACGSCFSCGHSHCHMF